MALRPSSHDPEQPGELSDRPPDIFERQVPVELSFDQVKKID